MIFTSNLTITYVSTGTSTPQGEQLCQIIFKSMHKCIRYGPDKLTLRPFHHLILGAPVAQWVKRWPTDLADRVRSSLEVKSSQL